MAKFKESFSEPFYMSNGSYCISCKVTRDAFIKKLEDLNLKDINFQDIYLDRVRYGFPPEGVEDRDDFSSGCWYTGASSSKGSKMVWTWKKNSRRKATSQQSTVNAE